MASEFNPIKITDLAMKKIKSIMNTKEVPDGYGLRIGIEGSGCGGNSHVLGFDTRHTGDMDITDRGISIYIAKKDVIYIAGHELDYTQVDEEQGFIFKKVQNSS